MKPLGLELSGVSRRTVLISHQKCLRSSENKIKLLGFGRVNLMFGGIVSCSKASTALIKLVIPEAPSEWPTLGFTYYELVVYITRLTRSVPIPNQ